MVTRQRGLKGRCTSSGSEEADGDAKKFHGGWDGGTGWYAGRFDSLRTGHCMYEHTYEGVVHADSTGTHLFIS